MPAQTVRKTDYPVAGVCVLNNRFSEDGVYDYAVPRELEDSVFPGRFVNVPFGIRNRVCLGLVMEVRDTSSYEMHKQILSVYPEILALDEEQMRLCNYLRTQVLSDTGSAARTIAPVAAMSHLKEYLSVRPDAVLPDSCQTSDRELFAFLSGNGEQTLNTIRKRFGTQADESLKRLRQWKLTEQRTVFTEAREGVSEYRWELCVDPESALALAAGNTVADHKITSRQQRQVLSVLVEEDSPMNTAELTERAGVSVASLNTLRKNGVIERVEHRVSRNPYTDVPFAGRTPLTLNEEQTAAFRTLSDLMDSGKPRAALLYGVTGSGKTHVITALVDRMLDAGRGVILLLPEIALTPQSVAIFCARYGEQVAVVHSGLSAGERYDAYCRIRRGDATVVIGTRSAVFAPVRDLGAIIIDEEQEHTYKSDRTPRYHAREVARRRCAYHNAMMVLSSATPLVESMKRARDGIYTEIRLTGRYGSAALPRTEIVDLRDELRHGNGSVLSARLADALGETLANGEQAILFLNRRGYNRTVTCRTCGKPIVCPRCSVAMTYHTWPWSYREGQMICHWCGWTQPLPKTCPECGGEHLAHIGYGTQRAEEELKQVFPQARVLRMDADTTSTKHAYEEVLGKFRRHEADVLLGTQMVTKGHDFPDVTLVGVLQADMSLYTDDYRAGEQTFAMLTQVIGRAGRRDRPGFAVIQTMNPDHEIIRLACEQDYEGFYRREIELRRLLSFPPFCDIATVTLTCEQESLLDLAVECLMREIRTLCGTHLQEEPLLVYGPFEAPVYKVDNQCRKRVLFKCRINSKVLQVLSELDVRVSAGTHKKVAVSVDINPNGL